MHEIDSNRLSFAAKFNSCARFFRLRVNDITKSHFFVLTLYRYIKYWQRNEVCLTQACSILNCLFLNLFFFIISDTSLNHRDLLLDVRSSNSWIMTEEVALTREITSSFLCFVLQTITEKNRHSWNIHLSQILKRSLLRTWDACSDS